MSNTLRWFTVLLILGSLIGCSKEEAAPSAKEQVAADNDSREVTPSSPSESQRDDVQAPAPASNKRALLVGIDEYLSEDVSDLEGCVNDTADIRDLLMEQFDFQDQDILVLTNEAATHEGIVKAFQEHLIEKATEDSVIVFHYSGHGSQMNDAGGEQREEVDGLDETLVPHDSRTGGIYDITDDELHGLFAELGEKNPKNVTFILDCCHSGAGLRSAGDVGARVRMAPADPRDPPAEAPPHARSAPRGDAESRFENRDYVLIAGCRANESSYEYTADGVPRGTLSYFLAREIRGARDKEVTYRDIMDQVKSKVSAVRRAQHPQLEGANLDQLVFGTASSITSPYVLASPDNDVVSLAAGRVHGLTVGSLFDVYAPGTKEFDDPETRAARVEITKVDAFGAEATITEGGPVAPSSRAVERVHSYKHKPFPLFFDLAGDSADDAVTGSQTLERVKAKLADDPLLKDHFAFVASAGAAQLVLSERNDGKIHIEGGTIQSSPVPAMDSDADSRIVNQIVHWAKWFNVLLIDNPSATLRIDFAVSGPERPDESDEQLGQVFFPDDPIEFKVTNDDRKPLYFAILNLESNGAIQIIHPDTGVAEALQPMTSWTNRTSVYLPDDQKTTTDYLKLVVFNEPVDLTFLTTDAAPKGDEEQFSFPLSTATLKTKGVRPIKPESWKSVTRLLKVVRPN